MLLHNYCIILPFVKCDFLCKIGVMADQERQRAEWAIGESRRAGLRVTRGLREIVRALSERRMPISLSQLGEDPTLKGQYDASTLYRVLLRLEERGIVRRIGLHGRSAHFILRAPGLHSHFLVCRGCGAIEEIDIDCPVRELDRTIEAETGYRDLEHDLSFYGLCRACIRAADTAQRRTA